LRIKSAEFKFKQFAVYQPEGVFKIGTDAVLLGAWANFINPKQILDIGCGTGVIGLMLAQRFPEAKITAIDPYVLHTKTTQKNFKLSPFKNQFSVITTKIQDFVTLQTYQNTFDCIVCNPPYFAQSLPSKTFVKNISRHQNQLSLNELFKAVNFLLHPNGTFSVILPFNHNSAYFRLAQSHNLFLKRICNVFSTVDATKPKRQLLEFSKHQTGDLVNSPLYLQETEHRNYTTHYKTLTREFYLKF